MVKRAPASERGIYEEEAQAKRLVSFVFSPSLPAAGPLRTGKPSLKGGNVNCSYSSDSFQNFDCDCIFCQLFIR